MKLVKTKVFLSLLVLTSNATWVNADPVNLSEPGASFWGFISPELEEHGMVLYHSSYSDYLDHFLRPGLTIDLICSEQPGGTDAARGVFLYENIEDFENDGPEGALGHAAWFTSSNNDFEPFVIPAGAPYLDCDAVRNMILTSPITKMVYHNDGENFSGTPFEDAPDGPYEGLVAYQMDWQQDIPLLNFGMTAQDGSGDDMALAEMNKILFDLGYQTLLVREGHTDVGARFRRITFILSDSYPTLIGTPRLEINDYNPLECIPFEDENGNVDTERLNDCSPIN